jgi:hypothetical protein
LTKLEEMHVGFDLGHMLGSSQEFLFGSHSPPSEGLFGTVHPTTILDFYFESLLYAKFECALSL